MSEWISVWDKSPPLNVYVLTCDSAGNRRIMAQSHYTNPLYWFGIGPDHPTLRMVTHWMPLPEPPKEAQP